MLETDRMFALPVVVCPAQRLDKQPGVADRRLARLNLPRRSSYSCAMEASAAPASCGHVVTLGASQSSRLVPSPALPIQAWGGRAGAQTLGGVASAWWTSVWPVQLPASPTGSVAEAESQSRPLMLMISSATGPGTGDRAAAELVGHAGSCTLVFPQESGRPRQHFGLGSRVLT